MRQLFGTEAIPDEVQRSQTTRRATLRRPFQGYGYDIKLSLDGDYELILIALSRRQSNGEYIVPHSIQGEALNLLAHFFDEANVPFGIERGRTQFNAFPLRDVDDVRRIIKLLYQKGLPPVSTVSSGETSIFVDGPGLAVSQQGLRDLNFFPGRNRAR